MDVFFPLWTHWVYLWLCAWAYLQECVQLISGYIPAENGAPTASTHWGPITPHRTVGPHKPPLPCMIQWRRIQSCADSHSCSEFMYASPEDAASQLSSPASGSYMCFLALCSLRLGRRDTDIAFRAGHCTSLSAFWPVMTFCSYCYHPMPKQNFLQWRLEAILIHWYKRAFFRKSDNMFTMSISPLPIF